MKIWKTKPTDNIQTLLLERNSMTMGRFNLSSEEWDRLTHDEQMALHIKANTPVIPFISVHPPTRENFAVGPCPYCGRLDTWTNGVPIETSCSGEESNPHKPWNKQIPAKHNAYCDEYDAKTYPDIIPYEDCRKKPSVAAYCKAYVKIILDRYRAKYKIKGPL